MRIGKAYSISASHNLPDHKGKCQRLHGHNYTIEIEVVGPQDENKGSSQGMVMDFGDLDAVVNPVLAELDHWHLNNVLPEEYQPPTAENLVLYLVHKLKVEVVLNRVRVWETSKAYAEWLSEYYIR